jgi:MFS family permease
MKQWRAQRRLFPNLTAAALLVPQGLSILSASFPKRERGHAIGAWSAWTTVFAALGPVAGGWLMEAWTWRLIFLLNLPLVLVILLLAPRIPESRALGDPPPPWIFSGPRWPH